jgi:hypothetical protein
MVFMSNLPYYKIPEPPTSCTSNSIMIRILDALGFRYYWATEGLTEKEYVYRPSPDSRNIRELIQHIQDLVNSLDVSLGGKEHEEKETLSIVDIRRDTLECIRGICSRLKSMNDLELNSCVIYNSYYDRRFPVWNVINGPLCDALTHVGQLNSWRRLCGNPVSEANVFLGEPPLK